MNYESYKKYRLLVMAYVALLTMYGVTIKEVIVVFGAVLSGMLFMFLLRRNLDKEEVIVDELVLKVSEKAANASLGLCTVAFAVVGLILMNIVSILSVIDGAPVYAQPWEGHVTTGIALSWSAMALLLSFVGFKYYFGKKYGLIGRSRRDN
ncbi:DUF2178 domain-containing protein [Methanococcus voltae]|uniref:Membrane protein n=2 Tax=Methanococcus voltae TaxID=2188 RepID=A0ABT2EVZ3_METVO|nr:DUF2178 domain-containing protein [Methanococcus voltae]MBP2172984.1 putative membrane protein [Methanococcus voltae]MBP2201960.1 putative membrane protein [Methanococcus voltae]MCS3922124.1 putative membrane protein [Methanococcus voltae PS]